MFYTPEFNSYKIVTGLKVRKVCLIRVNEGGGRRAQIFVGRETGQDHLRLKRSAAFNHCAPLAPLVSLLSTFCIFCVKKQGTGKSETASRAGKQIGSAADAAVFLSAITHPAHLLHVLPHALQLLREVLLEVEHLCPKRLDLLLGRGILGKIRLFELALSRQERLKKKGQTGGRGQESWETRGWGGSVRERGVNRAR